MGFREHEHSVPRAQKSQITLARATLFITIIVVLILLSLEGEFESGHTTLGRRTKFIMLPRVDMNQFRACISLATGLP